MKLIISKDYFLTGAKAAQIIEDQVNAKPSSFIALPSGPTPIGMFQQLTLDYQNKKVDFTNAHFMGVDEYFGLSNQHPDSVAHSLNERFFKPCHIRPDQIHLIDGAADPDEECASLNRYLDENGGLDLIVTGIGLNGHLAYNEPAEGLSPRVHVNGLGEYTRLSLLKDFSDQTEIPSRIITLGLADFLNARKLVVIATGPSKSSVVRRLVQASSVSTFFPASFVLLHRDAILIVDEVAGKELNSDSDHIETE
jgi:glucosamine-6-phosphate deaminase